MEGMSKAAQRAADSLAAEVLDKTAVGYGKERDDVLEAVARILRDKASQIRAARIEESK